MKDPVYQALSEVKMGSAGQIVHDHSVQVAELLLITAIKNRRDIVLDGTMSWAPFVEQTIAMVRDNTHTYKRGPGYIVNKEDGTVAKELYWEVESECEPKIPYRIELVGVTVDPYVAVRRGFIRKLLTGRGVPVRGQLKSHQLFSKNFKEYVNLFDSVKLYDNNTRKDTNEPLLIAWKDKIGSELEFKLPEYDRFLDKIHINPDANDIHHLYKQGHEPLDLIQRSDECEKQFLQLREQIFFNRAAYTLCYIKYNEHELYHNPNKNETNN